MAPMIEVSNLKYKYPHTRELVLKGISFSVEAGEFIGIVGKNGAGKSTLAQALMGLVPQFYKGAYGGTVMVNGRQADKTPIAELCKSVGLVFQNPFNQLSGAKETVYEEIAFGLQNLGIEREEMKRRIMNTLELLDIVQYKERNPFDLSGGQMQRVAIASILVMEPDILILDEPTSQLDPAGTEEVFKAVERLVKTGKTIMMVEQKIEKIAAYCDKILLMHQGELVAYDTPEKIFSRDDLEALGVQAPAFTRICKALEIKKDNGCFPVTEEEMTALKEEVCAKRSQHKKAYDGEGQNNRSEENRAAFNDTQEHAAQQNRFKASGNDIFEIKDMDFSYVPKVPIMQQLNLHLGQRPTAIIGQNGAGKTTLVKLLKGLLKPVKGSIYYQKEDSDKQDISQMTVAMLAGEVGYVFQNPDDQIFKNKVLDEVLFGPLNIGMSREEAKEKALEALGLVGMADMVDENPYDCELSERKLIAIASVIAMDTKVIILDEPTIAQDYEGRETIKRIIRELTQKGKVVVAILHDMDFVAECFERVVAMAHGHILADGTAREVFSQDEVLQQARLELPHVSSLCRTLGFDEIYLSVEEFV